MTRKAEKRSTPVIVGFPSPFRLVLRDKLDKWTATLGDINNLTYDYVRLNRVSAFFDGNIGPYAMAIGFDGSLVLPALPEFQDKLKALGIFNRVLAETLLGGIYTEAISPTEISIGELLPTGYIRLWSAGQGSAAHFHDSIRLKCPNPRDAIFLLEPNELLACDFESAVKKGRGILSSVSRLSPNVFLTGITYYIRDQWAEALVNIWTSIEQIIGQMWDENINMQSDKEQLIPGRKSFLGDHRSWPSSTRVEMLFQKGLFDHQQYIKLDVARKARNRFVHEGIPPAAQAVNQALDAVFCLISLCHTRYQRADELDHIRQDIVARGEKNLFEPPEETKQVDVGYWREIPHLPGEIGWKGKFEAFELGLVPLSEIKSTK